MLADLLASTLRTIVGKENRWVSGKAIWPNDFQACSLNPKSANVSQQEDPCKHQMKTGELP